MSADTVGRRVPAWTPPPSARDARLRRQRLDRHERLIRETAPPAHSRNPQPRPSGWAACWSPEEEVQLRRLVDQAWELRDGPYLDDAARAIVEHHDRTYPDRLERWHARRRR